MKNEPVTLSPLVADIISAGLAQTHAVTNTLIDSLTEQLNEAHAHEKAVRSGVLRLLSGQYMPTPDAIRWALYPTREQIDYYKEDTIS